MSLPRILCRSNVGAATLVLLCAAGCARHADDTEPAPPARAEAPAPPRPLPDPLPEIAARVDGEPVYTVHLKTLAEKSIEAKKTPREEAPGVYRELLNQFVIRELLFQEALRRGLVADRKAVEAAENKARAGYRNEEAWLAGLAAENLDLPSFRAQLRVQETVAALLAQETARVTAQSVTTDEITTYYTEHVAELTVDARVEARQIVVRVPPDVAALRQTEFRTQAEALLARARSGEDFATLAKESSDDRATAAQGGRMEPFGKGELGKGMSAVEEAALALSPGRITDVIDGPNGLYILKVEKRLGGGTRPLAEVEGLVRDRIIKNRRANAMQKLVNALRAKARVEIFI
jgi:parvulin-like peptidyl-prolyl isomerase